MSSSIKYPTGTKPMNTPRVLTMETVHKTIKHLQLYYGRHLPRTLAKLKAEAEKCSDIPTLKLREWMNILSNLFIQGKEIKVTEEKARLAEFLIGGA